MKNDENTMKNNFAPKPFAQLAPSYGFSPSILTLRPCVGRWRWHPSVWRCRCGEHKSDLQLFDTWTTLATCYNCYHMTYLMMSYSKYSSTTVDQIYYPNAPGYVTQRGRTVHVRHVHVLQITHDVSHDELQ